MAILFDNCEEQFTAMPVRGTLGSDKKMSVSGNYHPRLQPGTRCIIGALSESGFEEQQGFKGSSG